MTGTGKKGDIVEYRDTPKSRNYIIFEIIENLGNETYEALIKESGGCYVTGSYSKGNTQSLCMTNANFKIKQRAGLYQIY